MWWRLMPQTSPQAYNKTVQTSCLSKPSKWPVSDARHFEVRCELIEKGHFDVHCRPIGEELRSLKSRNQSFRGIWVVSRLPFPTWCTAILSQRHLHTIKMTRRWRPSFRHTWQANRVRIAVHAIDKLVISWHLCDGTLSFSNLVHAHIFRAPFT